MKIQKISIDNFKLLHQISLDLAHSSGNVVFLNARNGRGKTSFQSALKWCFYADQPEDSIVSKQALRDRNVGEIIKVVVEVLFIVGGEEVSVKRSQTFEKLNDTEARPSSQSELVVKISTPNTAQMTRVLPNPDSWLEENLPRRLMNYFLFDGELMYKFFDPRVRGAIDKAIKEIARVDMFESLATKYRNIESRLNHQIAKSAGGDSQKLLQDLENERKLALLLKIEWDENEEAESQKRMELQLISAKLAGREHLQTLVEERKSLQESLTAALSNRAEKQNEFAAKVLKVGVHAVIASKLPGFKLQIELAKSQESLPPPFEPVQLGLLLERGECICGCELITGSAATSNIKSVIDRYADSSDIGKELQVVQNEMQVVISQIDSGIQMIALMNNEIIKIDDGITDLRNRLDKIANEIGGDVDEDISALGRHYNLAMSELERLVEDRMDIERQSKQVAANVSTAQAKYDKAIAGASASDGLRQKAQVAKLLADSAERMHGEAIEIVRQQLESRVSQNFDFVKKGYFKTVITPEFDVVTLDGDGREVALSEGEKMLKAYLFSFALREVIGLSFPLIVDTPFGRLDEQYRLDIAKGLTEMVGKTENSEPIQSIFLMHDAEYTPYTKKVFEKLGAEEFYLQLENPEKSVLGSGISEEWKQIEIGAWRDWAEGKI